MLREIDPKDTTRAAAYALWMKAPNPMVIRFSKSKCWMLAALLMFVGATLQITNDHYWLGIVDFAAAVSFFCSAEVYRKREKEEKQKVADNK